MCGIALFLLSLPCLLGYNLWSNFRPIAGRDVLDSEDFLVSNLLLPLGSLLFIIFCTTRYGWGWENFLAEANEGKGLKIRQMAAALHDLRAARDREHHSGFRTLQFLRRVNAGPERAHLFRAILSNWQIHMESCQKPSGIVFLRVDGGRPR